MTLRFLYTLPNGVVAYAESASREILTNLIGKGDPKTLSVEDYRTHVLNRLIPTTATGLIELAADYKLPGDRAFREAWTLTAGTLEVDMPKARNIHMGRIRKSRDLKLVLLDKDWMKATGKGQSTASIEAERERLRQIPQTFDLTAAQTPEELAGLWPVI